MLALITAVAILNPLQTQTALDFRISFAKRKSDIASEVPDPAIQKCMDLIMAKVRRDVKASSSADDLGKVASFFSGVVAEEEVHETDYRSISVQTARMADRVAIGVRMGEVARLGVFKIADGSPIAVPKALQWSYRFQTAPKFIPGGLLLVNGEGIQDAGVRYGYRLLFLRPGTNGYTIGRSMRGVWTLAEEIESHIEIHGMIGTVRTIESPKSFFTDNVTRMFVKETIYVMDEWPFKVRMTTQGHAAINAVDEWMAESMKNPKTALQREFAKSYGTEPQMLEGSQEKPILPDSYEVTLQFDKKYIFQVHSTGFKMTIKSFRVAPV